MAPDDPANLLPRSVLVGHKRVCVEPARLQSITVSCTCRRLQLCVVTVGPLAVTGGRRVPSDSRSDFWMVQALCNSHFLANGLTGGLTPKPPLFLRGLGTRAIHPRFNDRFG